MGDWQKKKSTLSIETISAKRRGKNQPFPLKQKSRLELTIVEQRLPLFWLRKISEDSFNVLNFLVTRSIKNLLSSAMTIGKKKWWLSTFMHIFRLVIFYVIKFIFSRSKHSLHLIEITNSIERKLPNHVFQCNDGV